MTIQITYTNAPREILRGVRMLTVYMRTFADSQPEIVIHFNQSMRTGQRNIPLDNVTDVVTLEGNPNL